MTNRNLTLKEMQERIFNNAKSKGFHPESENPKALIAQRLMLIVSELSEALEADRNSKFSVCGTFSNYMAAYTKSDSGLSNEDYKEGFELLVKDTFEDELADATIRILDLAESLKIDLHWYITHKMRYNEMRSHKHGNKKY